MKNEVLKSIIDKKIYSMFIIAGIILLPLFFLDKGIDVTDTGFILSKYKYAFSPNSLNTFALLFSDFAGGILYKIVPSHQLFFLNFCGYIAYLLIAIMTYSMFKEYMNKSLLLTTIFISSLFTKRYLTIISYNTFTALVFCLGIYILINALKKDNSKLLFFAGVVLSSSMFFRLPNILQLGLWFVVIWYYYFCLCEKKIMLKKVIVFTGGILVGLIAIGVLLVSFYGLEQTFIDNKDIMTMATKSDDGHNIITMMKRIFMDCMKGAILLSGIIFVLSIFNLLKEKIYEVFTLVMAFTISFFLFKLYTVYYIDFITKGYLMIIAVASIFLSIYAIAYYRKSLPLLSALCVAGLLTSLTISLGTDNGIKHYAIFLHLPLTIVICVLSNIVSGKIKIKNKYILKSIYPVMASFLFLGLTIGFNLATKYVYRDAPNSELRYTVNHPVYYGMKTSEERARALNNFIEIMKPYKNEELLSYGSFTIGSLLTDMNPFFKTVWPDLASFSLATFQQQLQEKEKSGVRPVIALVSMEKNNSFNDYNKLALIMKFIAVHNYEIKYKDEYFTVYVCSPNDKEEKTNGLIQSTINN